MVTGVIFDQRSVSRLFQLVEEMLSNREKTRERILVLNKQASKYIQTGGSITRLIPKTLRTETGALGTVICSVIPGRTAVGYF